MPKANLSVISAVGEKYSPSTVFVLGAGFTRSFDKKAPLLRCDIGTSYLKRKYKRFPNILRVLDYSSKDKGLVNIEMLMSRLSSGMPYDDGFLPEGERKVLFNDVQESLLKQIISVNCEQEKLLILENFARYILKTNSSCITFNYDDMLDRALSNATREGEMGRQLESNFAWTPMHGYGFYIDSALSLNGNDILSFTKSTSLLLKLHGSINWYPKKGYKSPYPMNAVIHMQNWWPLQVEKDKGIIDQYEIAPIIIPPLFDKSSLMEQPILRTIWSKAFEIISEAKKVIFIGYSMPDTDYLVSHLFREALLGKQETAINIVTSKKNKDDTEKLKNRYITVFPGFSNKNIEFMDAAEWIDKNCSPS